MNRAHRAGAAQITLQLPRFQCAKPRALPVLTFVLTAVVFRLASIGRCGQIALLEIEKKP